MGQDIAQSGFSKGDKTEVERIVEYHTGISDKPNSRQGRHQCSNRPADFKVCGTYCLRLPVFHLAIGGGDNKAAPWIQHQTDICRQKELLQRHVPKYRLPGTCKCKSVLLQILQWTDKSEIIWQ